MNKTFLVKIGEEIHCGKCGDLLYLDANELAHHEKMDHVLADGHPVLQSWRM